MDSAKAPVETSSPFPASVLIPFLKITQDIRPEGRRGLEAGLRHPGTKKGFVSLVVHWVPSI